MRKNDFVMRIASMIIGWMEPLVETKPPAAEIKIAPK